LNYHYGNVREKQNPGFIGTFLLAACEGLGPTLTEVGGELPSVFHSESVTALLHEQSLF